jgi:hypothetical protein
MIADGDPIANAMFDKYRQVRMPNLRIGDDDFAELIGFLEKQSKAPEGAVAGSKDSGRLSAGNSSAITGEHLGPTHC